MLPSSVTTRCLSMSVLSFTNFFTSAFDVIGFRKRYFLTSSADMVDVDSVFCLLVGGDEDVDESASRLSPTVSLPVIK